MNLIADSPYLPKNKREIRFLSFKTSIAYLVWKRMLYKYGHFDKGSRFKLLEVGCGPGFFLRCIERWFKKCEIYGLDIDESLIRFSKTHLVRSKLGIYDAEELPFDSHTFDVVCSFQVIEHLKRPEKYFNEVKRVLKSNGLLLIATPNPAGITARVLRDKWQGYRYDHVSLKMPSEWRIVQTQAGFRILAEGTTGLTGFKILQILPFALINWIPMALFGFFPWYRGESYMAIARNAATYD